MKKPQHVQPVDGYPQLKVVSCAICDADWEWGQDLKYAIPGRTTQGSGRPTAQAFGQRILLSLWAAAHRER
jgi:hypothetical protein